MKLHRFFLVVSLLVLFFACKNNDCPGKVDLVQPDQNPPNYEVIIHPEGFSQQAAVRFGQQVATTRAGAGADIIARVPAGLRGNVEITLEENDCVGRSNFIVLDSLPGTFGLSLPTIVLPAPPSLAPPGITNNFTNAADPGHFFTLGDDSANPGHLDPFSNENHVGNVLLGAQIPNPVSGTWSITPNEIHLTVDRTQNGGTIEKFDGQFTNAFAGAPAGANVFLLLTSQTTGRQLVLYAFF